MVNVKMYLPGMGEKPITLATDGKQISAESLASQFGLTNSYNPNLIVKACEEIVAESTERLNTLHVLSTEGIDIKSKASAFGKKILEKIKWLIQKIVEFLQNIGKFFSNAWHKYVVNNAGALKQKINKADFISKFSEEKAKIYGNIKGALESAKSFIQSKVNFKKAIDKILAVIRKNPQTPEDAEQAAQEIEDSKGFIENIQGIGESIVSSAEEAYNVIVTSLTNNNLLEQVRKEGETLLETAKNALNQLKDKIASTAGNAQDAIMTKVYIPASSLLSSIISKLMSIVNGRGTLQRDREVRLLIGNGGQTQPV